MHFPVKLIVDNNNNHRYPQKDEQLRAAYASALKLARDNGLRRVGCSLISAGIFSGGRGLDNIMSISWQVRSLLRLPGVRMPFTAPLVWYTHAWTVHALRRGLARHVRAKRGVCLKLTSLTCCLL
jgi:hypothetical protein